MRDIGCSSKPVGDRGKKELPIRKGDLATFVITPAITALNFEDLFLFVIHINTRKKKERKKEKKKL